MNQQDIIRMAREAGFDLAKIIVKGVLVDDTTTEIKAFAALVAHRALAGSYPEMIALVAAAEREACAEVFDNISSDGHPEMISSDRVAEIIRARGETK